MKDNIEFSHVIDVMRLPAGGGHYEIAASAEQRAALAKRFGLLALDRLEAKVDVTRLAGGFYRLSAAMDAAPIQACVVTAEPVSSHITESFSLLYGPVEDEKDVILDGDAETVESIEDGTIDLGEAVAQQLSLALDPFPHSADAAAQSEGVSSGDSGRASPFAVLAQLQRGKKD